MSATSTIILQNLKIKKCCFIYNNLSEEPANAPSCKKQLFSLCRSRQKTQPCRDCRSILSFPHLESAKKKKMYPLAHSHRRRLISNAVVFNQPAHLRHSLMHPTIDWPRPLSLCCLHWWHSVMLKAKLSGCSVAGSSGCFSGCFPVHVLQT